MAPNRQSANTYAWVMEIQIRHLLAVVSHSWLSQLLYCIALVHVRVPVWSATALQCSMHNMLTSALVNSSTHTLTMLLLSFRPRAATQKLQPA